MSNEITNTHTHTHTHTYTQTHQATNYVSGRAEEPPHDPSTMVRHTCQEVDANNAGRGPVSFVSAPCCAETACT